MPGSAAQVAGTEFTQCAAVPTMPYSGPSPPTSEWKPLTTIVMSGLPRTSISYRWPAGPNVHAGSRFSSPISQFTVTRTTGSPSTRASQWNLRPATWPGSMTPSGESIGAVATAISWVARTFGSALKPILSTTIFTAWMKPLSSIFCIGPVSAFSGISPKPMTWRSTSGAS